MRQLTKGREQTTSEPYHQAEAHRSSTFKNPLRRNEYTRTYNDEDMSLRYYGHQSIFTTHIPLFLAFGINPYVTNVFPILIIWMSPLLGALGVIFHFCFIFRLNHVSKHNSPRWDAASCGVTSGAIQFANVP